MANTFTQLHIQFVFAVKKRQALIWDDWRALLHEYITGIVRNNGHKMLQVNSMPDHIHLLVGMRPIQSCSDLMDKVKALSSGWINNEQLTRVPFYQSAYGRK